MPPSVILLHQLPARPGGGSDLHIDWLIAPEGPPGLPDDRVLLAFRCERRPDLPTSHRFRARQLPHHRRAYLEFEGPLSGPSHRGRVARLATGVCSIESSSDAEIRVHAVFAGLRFLWLGRRLGPVDPTNGESDWRFDLRAEPAETA